jgi:hypothetical protein
MPGKGDEAVKFSSFSVAPCRKAANLPGRPVRTAHAHCVADVRLHQSYLLSDAFSWAGRDAAPVTDCPDEYAGWNFGCSFGAYIQQ